ncbi:RagB/SusD family nutrient uptake outer membrane protein [Chitinophaga qingshengii]|uniref:RagB/SusD family nutrient uptake outer membrane protein n=1 Tax=Chitinophaga qingshengii TaxID=1569794 RepID=A0ABR7TIB2_9BACT|nr:RagB/SusD family nutrient uptake outer membrane protein [Chitinophaga qingshengii]MBC9929129.1 RagB/SusD family nutrient uptake outer membrane protein [Chitinophaga qingshengii]
MKCFFRYSIIGLLAVSGASCSKLDETPYSSIYTEKFYQTAEDAEAALAAVYTKLADMYSGPSTLIVPDFSADQVYPRPVVGRDTYTLFSYDPEYSAAVSFSRTMESPVDIWSNAYAGIENANWVLLKVPNTKMTNEKRKQEILAEAYFMRAFFHWFLTKNFGDIVIRTKPSQTIEDAYVGKSPKADVYKQIYADLEAAIAGLPDYSASLVKGRPSKQAAQALYAKAALYGENWSVALQQAQKVITSTTGVGLMDDVTDVFNVAKEDVARKENLWAYEAESVANGRTSQMMSLYGPPNSAAPAYGNSSFGSAFAYQAFFDSFDPGDKRRQLMDTNYVNKQGSVVPQASITPVTKKAVLVRKYADPNSVGGAHATNIQILRMADVYLIAAEAEARLNGATGDAYTYINKVRNRAGLGNLTAGLAADAFIAAVLQERSWELYAEGDRWYDLSRTDTYRQVIPRAVNDVFPVRNPQARNRYFPIPQTEVNANDKLQQNAGW